MFSEPMYFESMVLESMPERAIVRRVLSGQPIVRPARRRIFRCALLYAALCAAAAAWQPAAEAAQNAPKAAAAEAAAAQPAAPARLLGQADRPHGQPSKTGDRQYTNGSMVAHLILPNLKARHADEHQ